MPLLSLVSHTQLDRLCQSFILENMLVRQKINEDQRSEDVNYCSPRHHFVILPVLMNDEHRYERGEKAHRHQHRECAQSPGLDTENEDHQRWRELLFNEIQHDLDPRGYRFRVYIRLPISVLEPKILHRLMRKKCEEDKD